VKETNEAVANTLALRVTAVMGFLAVVLGAFGAHGLKELLVRNESTAIWEKAVFYHFIHVLVMLMLALRQNFLRGAWVSFLIGIVMFSGSLYLLAVTGVKSLGAVTPVGGVGFLVGWAWLALRIGRNKH